MSDRKFEPVRVASKIGTYTSTFSTANFDHLTASGGEAVSVTLPPRQEPHALDFTFSNGAKSEQGIDTPGLLAGCEQARPTGFNISNNGKTLTVFYARKLSYEMITAARTALAYRVSKAADDLQAKYCWDPAINMVTDHRGVPIRGVDIDVHDWDVRTGQTLASV